MTDCVITLPNNYSAYVSENKIWDFTGTKYIEISGTITGTDGVTVLLNNGDLGSQSVNSGESYSFIVEARGDYTVTPSKSGSTFTPSSQSESNLNSDVVWNFALEHGQGGL